MHARCYGLPVLPLSLLLLSGACSDGEPAASGDGGSGDGMLTDHRPGAEESIPDGPDPLLCRPGTTLLARVDAARMLKDLQYLVGLGERRTHAGQQKAALYLKSELAKLTGLKVQELGYSYLGQSYVNLEVTVAGSEVPDEHVLAGAHYDSTSNDQTLAPGADDNASGTVAVLETARALAGCRPRRSVRLLFFSNEEKGLVGSRAYVSSIKASLPKNKLVGFISVDMVAYGPDNEDLDLATKPVYQALADDMEAAVKMWTGLKVKKIISDHCG